MTSALVPGMMASLRGKIKLQWPAVILLTDHETEKCKNNVQLFCRIFLTPLKRIAPLETLKE